MAIGWQPDSPEILAIPDRATHVARTGAAVTMNIFVPLGRMLCGQEWQTLISRQGVADWEGGTETETAWSFSTSLRSVRVPRMDSGRSFGSPQHHESDRRAVHWWSLICLCSTYLLKLWPHQIIERLRSWLPRSQQTADGGRRGAELECPSSVAAKYPLSLRLARSSQIPMWR